jgi:NAD(P)-dependent dehydrogenase (short-subunit alcohol dehydrogenase family)
MVKQGSGVIIFLTGSPARGHVPGATAIGSAFGAIESLTENLAIEISPGGVRVVCLRTTTNVDSRTIQQTAEALAVKMNATRDQMIAGTAGFNFLKVPAPTSDTAKAAVLIASDRARMFTGTVVNSTAGPPWANSPAGTGPVKRRRMFAGFTGLTQRQRKMSGGVTFERCRYEA